MPYSIEVTPPSTGQSEILRSGSDSYRSAKRARRASRVWTPSASLRQVTRKMAVSNLGGHRKVQEPIVLQVKRIVLRVMTC